MLLKALRLRRLRLWQQVPFLKRYEQLCICLLLESHISMIASVFAHKQMLRSQQQQYCRNTGRGALVEVDFCKFTGCSSHNNLLIVLLSGATGGRRAWWLPIISTFVSILFSKLKARFAEPIQRHFDLRRFQYSNQ